jgi:hypothetical protein
LAASPLLIALTRSRLTLGSPGQVGSREEMGTDTSKIFIAGLKGNLTLRGSIV